MMRFTREFVGFSPSMIDRYTARKSKGGGGGGGVRDRGSFEDADCCLSDVLSTISTSLALRCKPHCSLSHLARLRSPPSNCRSDRYGQCMLSGEA